MQDGSEDTDITETKAPVQDLGQDSSGVRLGTHGLPTSFGRQRSLKRSGDEPPDEKPALTLKRSHELDEDDSSDRIKSAYSLLGLAHGSAHQILQKKKMFGQVIYKKKHIRLQNRHLNMNRNPQKPKHVYFDDSGNLITDPIDKVKLFLKSTEEPEASNPMCISSDDDSDHAPPNNTPKRLMLDAAFSSKFDKEEPVSLFSHEYEDRNEAGASQSSYVDDIEIFGNPNDNDYFGVPNVPETQTKRKERKKKKKNNRFLNNVPNDIREDPVMMKYWFKRFSLFSKFDKGIILDRGKF